MRNLMSINETLSNLCSSTFWDSNVTWNSPAPDFTICFEKTILVWLPCAFLWLFTPLEIAYLRRAPAYSIPFNSFNVCKLVTIAVLLVTALVDIASYGLMNDDEHRLPVDFYSPTIKFSSFCLLFTLTYANIRCGIRSSGVLFIFIFLLVLFGAPQLRTEFNSRHETKQEITSLILYLLYYLAVSTVFLLNCFADASPTVPGKDVAVETSYSPENESSFLSKIFFAWVDKLTWTGYRRQLKDTDVWDLDGEMRTNYISQKFESRWQSARKQLRKTTAADDVDAFESEKLLKNGKVSGSAALRSKSDDGIEKVSIIRPLCEVFGLYTLVGVLFSFLNNAMGFCSPQILKLILEFVGTKEDEYLWRAFFYVFLLLVIAVLEMLFLSYSCYVVGRVGLQIRTALMSLIYKKAMKISNGTRRNFTVGEIVNLMAVDAQRFIPLVTYYLPFLSVGIIEILVAMYWLWNILGSCAIAGVVVFAVLMIINGMITPKIQMLQTKQMKYKDKRVKLTNEVLSGIKVLKLYACEPSFEKQISQIRDKEIRILRRIGFLQTWFSFTGMCIPFLISLVMFGAYVFMSDKNVLDPQITFVSLSLINIIKFPLYLLPGVVSGIVQCFVAVKRLNNFFNSEELDPTAVLHEQRAEPVVVENGEFSWESCNGLPILQNINMKVEPGSLVAVVGSVGSGKTSLLSAILGDMYKISGVVNTTGRLAYVSQQAWIRNATLEDNITFGRSKDVTFYDTVLEACAMIPDLKILPAGDQTELGEKGVNMSGGQKQRISLARAVYSDADTYLLDDPLSAVDSHVGKHIFEKVIGPVGLLKKKTRILVTHNVAYLPQVDHVIVLRNGTISESGTYNELLKNDGNFASFLATYAKDKCEGTPETDTDHHELKIVERNGNSAASPVVDQKKNETRTHTLVEKEAMQAGNVKWKVYAYYLRALGPLLAMVIVAANVLCQVFAVGSYYWLSTWSSDVENAKVRDKQFTYVGVYALWGLGQAISVTTLAVALYIGALKAAKYIHNHLLSSVLHWPVVIFDRIPSGRILNRFASDIDVLDNILPHEMLEFLKDTAIIVSTLFIFIYNTPIILFVLLPVTVAYCIFQRLNVATSKQLKRLESVSKSPIYSHFSDSITGAQSLRAYGLQTKFIEAAEKKIDSHLKNSYATFLLERWFVSRMSLLGILIILSATTLAILSRNVLGPALVGLSITYTLQVNCYFSWWIRHICEIETNTVAVERIEEYTTEVEQEAPWTLPQDSKIVPKNWPSRGEVAFQDFQVRYHDDLEPVLKGITFKVNGGEKVGIVGRTGAGKSSLTSSLFRLIEAAAGSIFVDDVDVSNIGLHTLRNQLTIIPQDPVLFSGTLRMNLDPAEKYTDESIWRALELAHLKMYVSSLNAGLQYRIEESGSNFSVGQRQLICLARALLRKTKILILDEATAAVDFETDDFIQAAIRQEFHDCTVLTIAHRLNTVMDYDRIMVLDEGRIVEFHAPSTLLESKRSMFYGMAVDAGLV